MSNGVKIGLAIVGIIVVIGIMIGGWVIGQYNRVIAMDEQVKAQWAQVDNQLKRRYDLIPNLVETVKGYAAHEKGIFENIAQARTQYFQARTPAEKIEASQQLEGVLSRLLVLRETYPQLKANESFLKLQDSLEGTENRIAVERKRYNEAVQALNAYRRSFMGRFIAALAGVGEAKYFETPATERETPKVKF
ncbi:MAG: LemA family protein [Alphaproteobacteria bacterium]|uniref:LemA family protein n=1 Tax=Candidatus Nitrobium versatile TaxID=2884831 RepID=A0A953M2T9_9BACT|nr:LemA family protein [Candidatus Nitrobium versatile]